PAARPLREAPCQQQRRFAAQTLSRGQSVSGTSRAPSFGRACASSIAARGEVFAHTVAQIRRARGDVATVDRNFRAADKARLVRREKQYKLGAFLWGALTVHQYRAPGGMRKGSPAAVVKARIGDLPRMDRIDPDGENCSTAVFVRPRSPICSPYMRHRRAR